MIQCDYDNKILERQCNRMHQLINEIIFGPRQNYDRRKEWHIRLSHIHVLEKKMNYWFTCPC